MSGLVGFLNTPVTVTTGVNALERKEWKFDNQGNIILPQGGDIIDFEGASVLNATPGTRITTSNLLVGSTEVVWSSISNQVSSAKLLIQVECEEAGDPTGWHSQVCEAIISSRGYAFELNGFGNPVMSVYGITYTSSSSLINFTVQRNATTRIIEVLGTTTGIASGVTAYIRINATEMLTRN